VRRFIAAFACGGAAFIGELKVPARNTKPLLAARYAIQLL
jgi:hypothetical protein